MAPPVVGRPVLGRPQVSPTARVQPRPAAVAPKDSKEVAAARKAVEDYERQVTLLHHMEADWEQAFPEAHQGLEDVKRQEDLVVQTIKKAKPLIAAAKMSIGDFALERKWAKAHYDEEEIARILAKANPDIVMSLLKEGVIAGLSLEREAAIAWFAQRPPFAKVVQPAFREEAEMTSAVTVPKL